MRWQLAVGAVDLVWLGGIFAWWRFWRRRAPEPKATQPVTVYYMPPLPADCVEFYPGVTSEQVANAIDAVESALRRWPRAGFKSNGEPPVPDGEHPGGGTVE